MILGFNAKAYYLSTGTRATWGNTTNSIHIGSAPGNLTEMDAVGDVELPSTANPVQVKIRRMGGFEAYAQGLTGWEPSFDILYEPTAAQYLAFELAYVAKSTIAVAFLDQSKSTSGAKGTWADYIVESFDKMEPLGEEQKVRVKLKLAVSSVPPEHVAVT